MEREKVFQVFIERGSINTMIGECKLEPFKEFYQAESEADIVIYILRKYPGVSLKDITTNFICYANSITILNQQA